MLRLRRSFFHARKSLAFRFVAVSALAIAAIVPVRLMEVRAVRAQAADTGEAAVSRIATTGIERLTNIIDESRSILTIAALLPTFASAGVPDCHPILTPIVAETGWINSLSAIRSDGSISCSSTSSAEGLQIGDRAYLRDALKSRRYQLSGLIQSRRTMAPALLAAVPVSYPESGTTALVMAINASWFTDVAQDVAHSAPGGVAIIVDGDRNVIGRSTDAPTGNGPDPMLDELVRMDRETARPMAMPDGTTMVFAVRDIPHSQSLLVIGVPQAELNRHALAIEANLFEDLAIAIGVIVLVFWLGHESFVRPVLTLASAARRMGRGKFDIDIDARQWAGEFQTLAAAITSASANLASRAQADARLKANLRAQSQEDPLTGLKNRRGLDQFVEFEWRICQRNRAAFAAIAFDIDFFKPFNDCYGHDAGDQALRAVAHIMDDQASHAGGLAARTGGEEFTIIAPGKTASEAKTIADAVSLRVTALRIPHAGSPLGTLTISAGIAAAMATDALCSSDVFRAADLALYGAKEAGRNTITTSGTVRQAQSSTAEGDTGGSRPVSLPDTESRMPPAFPSARSR